MKAVKCNLKLGDNHTIMYCECCHVEYSGNGSDYSDFEPDYFFKCHGQPMRLIRKRETVERSVYKRETQVSSPEVDEDKKLYAVIYRPRYEAHIEASNIVDAMDKARRLCDRGWGLTRVENDTQELSVFETLPDPSINVVA